MEQPKVLIVDDDSILRTLLRRTLASEPYTILEAIDGPQALTLADQQLPDLILLDVMMPGMDGVAVLRQLKLQDRTCQIPVIMVTALAEESHITLCLEEGAVDHIAKPFSALVLRARVKAALRARLVGLPGLPVPPGPKRGRLIGFIGAKGGVGTTTAVVNTALALVAPQRSVAVVELRAHPGTAAQQLSTTPLLNLQPLLDLASPGDLAQTLGKCLTPHPTGLKLLLAPPTIDDQRAITPAQAEEILKTLTGLADYVLADLPFPPSAATRTALQQCDFVVVTVELEVTCLLSAQTLLTALAAWQVEGNSVGTLLILHQSSAGASVTVGHARKELKCRFVGVIPPAGEQCLTALKTGQPLVISAPHSAAAVAFTELAARLMGDKILPMTF